VRPTRPIESFERTFLGRVIKGRRRRCTNFCCCRCRCWCWCRRHRRRCCRQCTTRLSLFAAISRVAQQSRPRRQKLARFEELDENDLLLAAFKEKRRGGESASSEMLARMERRRCLCVERSCPSRSASWSSSSSSWSIGVLVSLLCGPPEPLMNSIVISARHWRGFCSLQSFVCAGRAPSELEQGRGALREVESSPPVHVNRSRSEMGSNEGCARWAAAASSPPTCVGPSRRGGRSSDTRMMKALAHLRRRLRAASA
jgi:hypothetical protein